MGCVGAGQSLPGERGQITCRPSLGGKRTTMRGNLFQDELAALIRTEEVTSGLVGVLQDKAVDIIGRAGGRNKATGNLAAGNIDGKGQLIGAGHGNDIVGNAHSISDGRAQVTAA